MRLSLVLPDLLLACEVVLEIISPILCIFIYPFMTNPLNKSLGLDQCCPPYDQWRAAVLKGQENAQTGVIEATGVGNYSCLPPSSPDTHMHHTHTHTKGTHIL